MSSDLQDCEEKPEGAASSTESADGKETSLPENLYDVTAQGHVVRAIALRQNLLQINPQQFALYAALELRNAIERLLFEYLVLIHGEKVSKQIEKEYSAKDLKQRIENIEPEFCQRIAFMNLMLRAIDAPPAVIPDLDALSTLYARLNNYLHAWKRPEKTAQKTNWWTGLWQTLDEAERMLTDILSAPIGQVRQNETGLRIYDEWKRSELSDEQVIEFFRSEFSGQETREGNTE